MTDRKEYAKAAMQAILSRWDMAELRNDPEGTALEVSHLAGYIADAMVAHDFMQNRPENEVPRK